ncbi:DUF551 domain-containing protein [[Empedobacter] haloabium]|uniref:DUF551 domain-containing protein n=1 Tax=[Empedobacter] haloabium TaxID=592317 RepID=A0ABZ1USL1_9BURK
MTNNYDELLKLAEAATPGPWILSKYGSVMDTVKQEVLSPAWAAHADKLYIAAANPAVIKALLSELTALRAAASAPKAEVSDERAAFEAWAKRTHTRPGTHFRQSHNGVYTDNRIAAKWAAWQARAVLAQAAPVAVPAEPITYLRWWARQINEGHGNIGHEEGYEVCEKGETSDDGTPAFPVFAAPAAPVAAAVPAGWVSVDERLPECMHECTSSGCDVSNTVLIYGETLMGMKGTGFGHARDDGTWACYDGEYDQMTVEKVTHWMPLPERPAAPAPGASK